MTFEEQYARALDEFLVKIEQIPEVLHPDTQDALGSICHVLRISRIKVTFYENFKQESEHRGQDTVIYKDGECCAEAGYIDREVTAGDNVAVYCLSPYAGDEEWNEQELKKIRIFVKTLYAFHGRRRVMKIAEKLMYHDNQLGVCNLQFFLKKGEEYVRNGKIWDYDACYFNLKNFSMVNDRLGRRGGTEVMGIYVQSLQKSLGEDEYVCRVGGDNFTVLFKKEHLHTVEEHLRGTLINCEAYDNASVLVSASAGFLIIEDNGDIESCTDIMDRISIAENIAKGAHGSTFVYFSQELMDRQREIKRVEALFPDALKDEEFQVYYQPKICLTDYSLAGAEALCRWQHEGVLVPPDDFVPVLEQSVAVCKLDFYMLEHVCRDIRQWIDEGMEVVRISVNMSRRHMGDRGFLKHILEIIDKYDVPHKYIEIELTETTTEVGYEELQRVVIGLQEQGIHTSVDDFGVGFSSLNLIRSLPWDMLKIDKSFLPTEEGLDRKTDIIFRNIIAMANEMGIECIVEGVESEEQVILLKEYGCFLAQGFYFGAAMPAYEFSQKLNSATAI